MPQYFFVDESGDPGLHSLKGSSYFVLVMVQLPNREPIEKFVRIRQILKLPPNFEFHFNPMTEKQKRLFFSEIESIDFRARAAVFLKSNSVPIFKGLSGTEIIIRLITNLILRASPLDVGDDILVLDGASEPVRKALRIYLSEAMKQAKRERPFKKIVSGDSRIDDGLQLADMVAGAIREHIWHKNSQYFNSLGNRVIDLWHINK